MFKLSRNGENMLQNPELVQNLENTPRAAPPPCHVHPVLQLRINRISGTSDKKHNNGILEHKSMYLSLFNNF